MNQIMLKFDVEERMTNTGVLQLLWNVYCFEFRIINKQHGALLH